jgi:hypothetical protein
MGVCALACLCACTRVINQERVLAGHGEGGLHHPRPRQGDYMSIGRERGLYIYDVHVYVYVY